MLGSKTQQGGVALALALGWGGPAVAQEAYAPAIAALPPGAVPASPEQALPLTWLPAEAMKPDTLPPIRRELRGAWVATVRNIDWPSKPGLSAQQQQQELLAIMDRAAAMGLNALVLQVRPAADAMYPSPFEPWSEFLTGQQGRSPGYDPLAFAVREAHARGLELHAWINPFRARMLDAQGGFGGADPRHVSRSQPDWVVRYGNHQWMDPGRPEVRARAIAVAVDLAARYDLDAIHYDDYFYPYPEERNGAKLPFPDDASHQRYLAAGGRLERAAWRRSNVDAFVEGLYSALAPYRPRVKVGISPFGIYKPGDPPQIQGMDQVAALHADPKRWLEQGWLDYCAPQLYWSIEGPAQSFPVLLHWWAQHNPLGRHLWPGLYTSRVEDGSRRPFDARQITEQVRLSRTEASGHLHFSMKALMADRGGVASALRQRSYQGPALPPASPWLDAEAPPRPRLAYAVDEAQGRAELAWQAGSDEAPARWACWERRGGQWAAAVRPLQQLGLSWQGSWPEGVAVAAVDAAGNLGPPAFAYAPGQGPLAAPSPELPASAVPEAGPRAEGQP